MTIWVDADACPKAIKEVLYRAAQRVQHPCVLVANQFFVVPKSPFIKMTVVASGFDEADNFIAAQAQSGDLVITADIPLAHDAIENGAEALHPRGEKYSIDTIKQKLTMRDLMDQLRGSGEHTGGPPPMHARDVQAFANQLDKWLAKRR